MTFTTLLLAVAVGVGQGTAPAIPDAVRPADKAAYNELVLALAGSKFDEAARLLGTLTPRSPAPVFVNSFAIPTPLRADYKRAIGAAIHAWNTAAPDLAKFVLTEKEEEAAIVIEFDRDVAEVRTRNLPSLVCLSVEAAPVQGKRRDIARLALNKPYEGLAHTPDCVTHVAGQALGSYLGLGPAENMESIMGPDIHGGIPSVVAPTPADVEAAKAVAAIRRKFAELVEKKQTIHMPRPVIQIDKTNLDAGPVWRGEVAKFEVEIRNNGDAPLEISAKPNCGCAVAEYDRVILPGKSGKLTAEMRTSGFKGPIQKAVDVTTNDPATPHIMLSLTADIRTAINVVPTEAPLILLQDEGPTRYEMSVTIEGKDPVQIIRTVCPNPNVKLDLTKKDERHYDLVFTIAPEFPVGRASFIASLVTDSTREPQVAIVAVTEKGILAMPPNVFLGLVAPATPLPVTQDVVLTRKSGPFKVLKAESDDPALKTEIQEVRAGQEYRVKISYTGGWPSGLQRKMVKITTDDKHQPTIDVQVQANVVARGGP